MDKLRKIGSTGFMLLMILALNGFAKQTAYAQETPNIIIIFTDDLGYGDLACYGNPVIQTPQLDKMADEGMRFTQFYVAASVCTPSRAGLLTGRYPIRTGLVEGIIPGRVLFPNSKTGLQPHEVTIAEVLKQKNYATMAIGKWHLGHLPEYLPTTQGFDSYYGIPYSNDMDYIGPKDGKPGYWNVPIMRDTEIVERPAEQTTLTKRYTEEAVRFIQQNSNHPFFLYLAHSMPHIPIFASEDFVGRSIRGLYGDVIEEIDWSVGQILKTLREEGIDKKTLVIFTSDNGPWLVQKLDGGSAGPLKAGKGTTWEGGMREPMIAWWPGTVPAGETSTELATTLDLLPTAAAVSGAKLPENELDGYNILPVLKGEAPSAREVFYYYRGDEVYAVRMGPWKAHFITQTAYPDGPQEKHTVPLLYQLENDPGERFDVADENPDTVEKMQQLYLAQSKKLGRSVLPEVEGEDYINEAKVTGGRLRIQELNTAKSTWGNNKQLWWVEASPGDELLFPVEIEKDGLYELTGFFTRAKDYGIISVSVNDKITGDLIDGYANGLETTGPLNLGNVELRAGTNTIKIKLIGKDTRSAGYSDGLLVGIDGFSLRLLNN